jgi:tRNA modification GTPase
MKLMLDDRAIVACSSSTSSNAAIGMIRLSGFHSLEVFEKRFNVPVAKIKPRYAHLVTIYSRAGEKLDEGIVVYFPAPKSYTGENILEITVHGGQLNINKILHSFTDSGDFRLASAGEFTWRALKNKKLSLTQIEGLDLFLHATSEAALVQGLDTLHGQLHREYLALHTAYLKFKTAIELLIDFSDDFGEENAVQNLQRSFSVLAVQVEALYARTKGNINALLLPEIVIVGRTNAGKSSLFNSLCRTNRAIVSEIPGTTRDYITESICIEGTHYHLVDTAGARKSRNLIEKEGIRRAKERLATSFYTILVVNPFQNDVPLPDFPKDFIFDALVFTHADIKGFSERVASLKKCPSAREIFKISLMPQGCDFSGSIEPKSQAGSIEPKSQAGSIEPRSQAGSIEPRSQAGSIEPDLAVPMTVVDQITRDISGKYKDEAQKNPILIHRHQDLLRQADERIKEIQGLMASPTDAGILSAESGVLGGVIEELIGIITPEDVLKTIFENFCIGK